MKSFGHPDPLQDARRVLTASSGKFIADDVSAQAIGNAIYVWHADGSDVEQFWPDETGLTTALAAAVANDTVWLPSIPIALTAGISLTAYTALVGISEYSLLIASGFDGAVITMAEGAVCHRFSLVFSAAGTNAIGIDARFAAAVVDNVNVDVWGGSGSNTAIYAGAAEA